MKNSELKDTPDRLLTGIDKQRKYLVELHSQKRPCPNCAHLMDFYEGHGIDMDDYNYLATLEKGAECTKCHRALKHVVPLISLEGWHWSLVPVDFDDTDLPGDTDLLAQAERGYEEE
jgi:hypothetical protein